LIRIRSSKGVSAGKRDVIAVDAPVSYLTLGSGKAIRYGVGVGREGFSL
jgi:lipoprotein-anchoring transpeptidase ErfK/SrfK